MKYKAYDTNQKSLLIFQEDDGLHVGNIVPDSGYLVSSYCTLDLWRDAKGWLEDDFFVDYYGVKIPSIFIVRTEE